MRHLVIAPQWIGDAVTSHSLIQKIAKQDAQALIKVLAVKGVAEVFAHMPEVGSVLLADFQHGRLQWRERRQLASQLRAQFDVAWVLPNSFKAALLPYFAKVAMRVGYRTELRSWLLTHSLPAASKKQRPLMTAHYAALAQALPQWRHASEVPTPHLRLAPDAGSQVPNLPSGAYIALCPGAEFGPAKQWPLEHYAQLLALLVAQGHHCVLLGGPKDQAAGQSICAMLDANCRAQTHNYCGQTSLSQAIILLAKAHAVVSNDSGLMHIAAALQRPTLGLYGSTDPLHTPPAGMLGVAQVATLSLGKSCSPCFQRNCPLPSPRNMACLRDMSPAYVAAQLQKLFR